MNESGMVFPNRLTHQPQALSDDYLSLEGMKVVFDENVTLFPVELENTSETRTTVISMPRKKLNL